MLIISQPVFFPVELIDSLQDLYVFEPFDSLERLYDEICVELFDSQR